MAVNFDYQKVLVSQVYFYRQVADSEKKITAIDHIAHSGFRSNNSEYGFDHFTSGSNDPDPIVGFPDVINVDPGPSFYYVDPDLNPNENWDPNYSEQYLVMRYINFFRTTKMKIMKFDAPFTLRHPS